MSGRLGESAGRCVGKRICRRFRGAIGGGLSRTIGSGPGEGWRTGFGESGRHGGRAGATTGGQARFPIRGTAGREFLDQDPIAIEGKMMVIEERPALGAIAGSLAVGEP